jgi:hypothetical protein
MDVPVGYSLLATASNAVDLQTLLQLKQIRN